MISYKYINNLYTESVIFDDKPIFYNKEMWDKNECNIIFITGHSGAAKSTTGAKMATESYSLDDVIEQYRFSDENFKEYGDLISSYFNGIGKKYRLSLDEIQKTTTEKTYEIPVLHNFIDYAIRYAKSHKNKKFCIEGIQLFQWFEPSEFKDYPVLILGTSVLKSNHRASKRDAKDADSKFKKAGAYVKNILSIRHYKNYLDDEKYLKKWRKYFKDLMKKEEEPAPKVQIKQVTHTSNKTKEDDEYSVLNDKYLMTKVTESCKDLATARKFASEVKELAKKYDANFYLVTDGASATNNDGTNDAVKYARDTMKKWETKHGFDANEDWSK